ncbi:hypothetical protein ACFTY7_38060 [Streptomyces sp. NPDC057062]|uniref:hypothetical protein n=1 Tax=Streptomyces sp. NPDC057062 TaxID=3346011 RepID=UPI00363C0298
MKPGDAQRKLRDLLNEWDPIGVADLVQDEYDCLISPILSRLTHGAGRAEMSEFLGRELTQHFGLSHPYDVDRMAERLTAWWMSTGTQWPVVQPSAAERDQ